MTLVSNELKAMLMNRAVPPRSNEILEEVQSSQVAAESGVNILS